MRARPASRNRLVPPRRLTIVSQGPDITIIQVYHFITTRVSLGHHIHTMLMAKPVKHPIATILPTRHYDFQYVAVIAKDISIKTHARDIVSRSKNVSIHVTPPTIKA